MRILIIEDDPAIAANLYDYLEAAGYVPEHTADGVTGLHRAVSAQWSAILLDVSLPGMDGFTVCRKLREEARKDTPVLMLTAKDTLDDKLAGFGHGADDYLVKPFSLKEVGAAPGRARTSAAAAGAGICAAGVSVCRRAPRPGCAGPC